MFSFNFVTRLERCGDDTVRWPRSRLSFASVRCLPLQAPIVALNLCHADCDPWSIAGTNGLRALGTSSCAQSRRVDSATAGVRQFRARSMCPDRKSIDGRWRCGVEHGPQGRNPWLGSSAGLERRIHNPEVGSSSLPLATNPLSQTRRICTLAPLTPPRGLASGCPPQGGVLMCGRNSRGLPRRMSADATAPRGNSTPKRVNRTPHRTWQRPQPDAMHRPGWQRRRCPRSGC